MTESLDPPPSWGNGSITEFLDRQRRNQYATFDNMRRQIAVLDSIGSAFEVASSKLVNPQNELLPFFLIRSHSAYLAACSAAMAGHMVETFPVLRLCLECACYALKIDRDPAAGELWLRRGEDRRAVRRAFHMDQLRPLIGGCDERLLQVLNQLIDRSTEAGSHPNEFGVMASLLVERGPEHVSYQQAILHGEGPVLKFAIKSVAEAGLCSLFIFQHTQMRARFELLGLRERLQRLRGRVDRMFV